MLNNIVHHVERKRGGRNVLGVFIVLMLRLLISIPTTPIVERIKVDFIYITSIYYFLYPSSSATGSSAHNIIILMLHGVGEQPTGARDGDHAFKQSAPV
jgi:hypothetical protein